MGRRLLSKAWYINPAHEALVDYAADQEGGEQNGFITFDSGVHPVPFGSSDPPLADRKYLILTFPSDRVWMGNSNVTGTTGYSTQGRKAGSGFDGPPGLERYSSRKQFLRGQYKTIELLDEVPFFVTAQGNLEAAVSLELA